MDIGIKSKFLTATMVISGYKEGHIDAKNMRFEDMKGKQKLILPIVFNIKGKAETVEYAMNKRNHKKIIAAWGSKSEDLDGQKITLTTRKVDFEGEEVDSVVIEPEEKAKKL